ncbi:MAG TPA: hypothetical protein VGM46_07400 [Mesorhizobium sp.]
MTRFSAFSLRLPGSVPTILLGLLLAVGLAAPSFAAEMNFYMKNQQDRGVAVELFSQSRSKVWPGGDKVYFLDSREKKSVPVTCEEGERICYGAWVNGDDTISFGVGPDNDKPPCEYCCFTCAPKSTQVISITK